MDCRALAPVYSYRRMMRILVAYGCTALLVGAVPPPAVAQPSKERPFIQATKVDSGPRIDGVLDDAA